MGVHAPEEVVGELGLGRLLEAGDGGALRVHRGHHVPDGAVLAGGVDALEHDEQRVLLLGVEPVLQLGQARDLLGELGLGALLVLVLAVEAGVDRLELHLRAGLDDELLAVVHGVPPSRPRPDAAARRRWRRSARGGTVRWSSSRSVASAHAAEHDRARRGCRPRPRRWSSRGSAAPASRSRTSGPRAPGWRGWRRGAAAPGKGGRKNQPSLRVTKSSRWPPATSCRNITVCSAAWSARPKRAASAGSDSASRPISSRPNDWIDAEEAEDAGERRAGAASSSGSASG